MIRVWVAVRDPDRRAALIRMLRTDPAVRLVGSEAEAEIVCREAEPVPDSAADSVMEMAESQFASVLAANGGLGLAALVTTALSAAPPPPTHLQE